jgi:HEAT repeat protein
MEEAVPALVAATTDSDAHVRRGAVSALSFSGMKPAGEAIVHALADQDWMVREVAAETLGICKAGVQSADALIKVLADEFWQVRLKGVRSLGVLRVNRAVAAIGACLGHPQANLRKESAAALGEIADPAGLPFLEGLADDPDPDVRKNVRWALQRIGASGAVAR